jgi:hypothetical protein
MQCYEMMQHSPCYLPGQNLTFHTQWVVLELAITIVVVNGGTCIFRTELSELMLKCHGFDRRAPPGVELVRYRRKRSTSGSEVDFFSRGPQGPISGQDLFHPRTQVSTKFGRAGSTFTAQNPRILPCTDPTFLKWILLLLALFWILLFMRHSDTRRAPAPFRQFLWYKKSRIRHFEEKRIKHWIKAGFWQKGTTRHGTCGLHTLTQHWIKVRFRQKGTTRRGTCGLLWLNTGNLCSH